MTNKPMLSVEREVIEKALRDALTIRFDTDSHVTKLRSLLDKPAEIDLTPKRLAHAESVIEQQNNVIKSLRAELVESYRVDSKHQGEPVVKAMTRHPKGGMCCACQHARRDCSALPFKAMPPIQRDASTVILRCTDFKH